MKNLVAIFGAVFTCFTVNGQVNCRGSLHEGAFSLSAKYGENQHSNTYNTISDLLHSVAKTADAVKQESVPLGSVEWIGPGKIKNFYSGVDDVTESFSKSSLEYHKERSRSTRDVLAINLMNVGFDLGIGRFIKSPQMVQVRALANELKAMLSRSDFKDATSPELLNLLQKLKEASLELTQKIPEMLASGDQLAEKSLIDASIKILKSYYRISATQGELRQALGGAQLQAVKEEGVRFWISKNYSISRDFNRLDRLLLEAKEDPKSRYLLSEIRILVKDLLESLP